MRARLSDLISRSARADPRFLVLSGDHGYALFDALRTESPRQFINAGVAEQSMVGLAAGLARMNFRPMVYGLASFVPMRVVEQIKLDVCLSDLPVIFLGDGAGLVYSTLGASHQCAEDLAVLRPLPNLRIFCPADAHELDACFHEALTQPSPAYIRIGKADRPPVHAAPLTGTDPVFTSSGSADACLVAHGAMVSIATEIARELGVSCLSVPRLKPFPESPIRALTSYRRLIVIEEHSRHGGLFSALCECLSLTRDRPLPRLSALTLEDRFSELCGDHQFALSEHGLSDKDLHRRVRALLAE